MTALNAQQRSALPTHSFAGPARSFPVENQAHAVAALRLVGRAQSAGHLTPEEAAQVRAKAHAMLAANAGGYGGRVMDAAKQ